mmetsp:Transcript_46388/g.122545  ORF Transcript_46388/g.122545 Transcript_46388/m.122545 type:complete len:223 (-) Transcript_46388:167-835(-)
MPPPKTFSLSAAMSVVCGSSICSAPLGEACSLTPSMLAANALSRSARRAPISSAATRISSASAWAASSCLLMAVASALAMAMAASHLENRFPMSFSKNVLLFKTASWRSATCARIAHIISSFRSPSATTCLARKASPKLATSDRTTRRINTMKAAVSATSNNSMMRFTSSCEMSIASTAIARAFRTITTPSAWWSLRGPPAPSPDLPRRSSSSLSHDAVLEG